MNADLVRRATELTSGDGQVGDEELAEIFTPDVVLDFSARVFNPQVYEGYEGLREFYADSRDDLGGRSRFSDREIVEEGDRVPRAHHVRSRARGSGIEYGGERARASGRPRDGRLAALPSARPRSQLDRDKA